MNYNTDGIKLHPHPFPCYVPPRCTEALCERAHHDVHVAGVQPKVVHHPSAPGAQRPYAVGLVQVQVGPVALLQGDHLRQPHYAALHTERQKKTDILAEWHFLYCQARKSEPLLFPTQAASTAAHTLPEWQPGAGNMTQKTY